MKTETAYAAAYEAHNIASRAFRAATDVFRNGGDYDVFDAAQVEFAKATGEFDVAFAKASS